MTIPDKSSRNVAEPLSRRHFFPAWNELAIYLPLLIAAVMAAFVQPKMANPDVRYALSLLFQGSIVGILIILGGKLAWDYLEELGYKRREIFAIAGTYILFCSAGLLFLRYYFNFENDIKIYDSSTYWIFTLESQRMLADSIHRYLLLFRNAAANEYTYFLAFPLSLAVNLFGESFAGYCRSIFFIYYLPACLFLTILSLRLVQKIQKRAPGLPAFLTGFSLCVLCPVFFRPLVLGYTDVGGVLLIAVILNYTFDWDGVSFSWRRNIILAGLSVLLLLSRRWYAFYIVGFYSALGLASLIELLARRTFTGQRFGFITANLAVIATISALAIFIFNPHIFIAFLGKNYADAYSAFKMTGPWASVWYFVQHIGLAFFIAFIFGAAWFLRKKETSLTSIRLLGAGVIAAALFLTVQDPAPHHQYLMTPTVLIFLTAFAAYWVEAAAAAARPFIFLGFLPVLAANFAFAFIPAFQDAAETLRPIPTAIRSYPKHLDNYDVYRQIYADLLEKSRGRAASVYIVGEGDVFNPEYFRRINLPVQEDAAGFAMTNSTVDLRDGFPSQMFPAEYVMFVDPFSSLFPTVQQVSYQIYDMLLHDQFIAQYYALDKTYSLANHEAKLYRKIRPIDRPCVDVLKERLRSHYPGTPFVYEPVYFLALMEYDRQMTYYNFWTKSLLFYTENGEAVQFHLNDTKTFSRLSFEVESQIPGAELVITDQGQEIFRSPIPDYSRTAVNRDISSSDSLTVRFEGPATVPDYAGVIHIYFNADSLAP